MVIIGFTPIKIATKEDGINWAPHEIIENGNEKPKKPIRKLHNQKFREIGNFLFKIKKNNKTVILPIISLKDITLSGLIVKHLDQIPTGNICVTLDGYKIETTQLEDNVVRQVKVSKII